MNKWELHRLNGEIKAEREKLAALEKLVNQSRKNLESLERQLP